MNLTLKIYLHMRSLLARKNIKNFVKLLGIIIAFYILYDLYQKVSIPIIIEKISDISLVPIIITTLIYLGLLKIYVLRFNLISRGDPVISFDLVGIGLFLNHIFPFRIGDLIRLLYIRKKYRENFYKFFVSIIVEKILDLITIVGFASLIVISNIDATVGKVFGGGDINNYFLIASFIILIFTLFYHFRVKFLEIIKKNISIQIKVNSKEVWQSMKITQGLIVSIIIWLVNIYLTYYFFSSYVGAEFTYYHAAMLLIMIALSLAVPAAPAGMGFLEGVIVYFLTFFHKININEATALALIYHGIIVIPQMIEYIIFKFIIRYINIYKDGMLKS